jgi:outer membrane protein
MNKLLGKRTVNIAIILYLLFSGNIKGQTINDKKTNQKDDSLSLKTIIQQVIKSHPSVKAAEEAINNADSRIGLAKTGFYPEVDVTASYSNLQPVVKITIPSMGAFQLYPENNYSASINYRQVVYDFGRTRENIALENEGKAIGEQALAQVKQKLSLYAVNNFYSLLFLQAAIEIKDEQLSALNEHLQYVEKMKATGSATEYQVLTTKVKISTIESQKVDLKASIAAQQASMKSLLGVDQSANPIVKKELSFDLPVIPTDSVFSYAYHNRDEVLLNEKRTSLAELRMDMVKLQNKPMLSLQASGGAKNGYVPDLNKITPNYVVGLGLRVPIFDGMKKKYNLLQAQSAITSLGYESDMTKRTISTEISEAEVYLSASMTKIGQYELQLTQAQKAYKLAEISFKSGVITNLDLLDANTAVSESELLLLKAKIDYAASIYKLKAALGERLY